MRKMICAAVLAAMVPTAVVTPAFAQSQAAQARWDTAQRRYQQETDLYYSERDRFYAARGARQGYGAPPPPPSGYGGYQGGGYQGGYQGGGYAADDRYDPNFDAADHYRNGNYQERTLADDDRVYRGSDGRYYCRRSDGTTGLIAGGAAGGVLGNVIDGGHSRTAGTLIGAALGALAGKAVDQNQSQIRCR